MISYMYINYEYLQVPPSNDEAIGNLETSNKTGKSLVKRQRRTILTMLGHRVIVSNGNCIK